MADRLTQMQRSANMRQIKSKNTRPELAVRKIVWKLGYRYRLHRKDLPGCPDIVFGPQRKLILVHGCYWHGHGCKRGGAGPKSNQEYWAPKIAKNKARDEQSAAKLKNLGWKLLIVWECETDRTKELTRCIRTFLRPKRKIGLVKQSR